MVLDISLRFFLWIFRKKNSCLTLSIWINLRAFEMQLRLLLSFSAFLRRFTNHELHETTIRTSSQIPASEHCFWRTPWLGGSTWYSKEPSTHLVSESPNVVVHRCAGNDLCRVLTFKNHSSHSEWWPMCVSSNCLHILRTHSLRWQSKYALQRWVQWLQMWMSVSPLRPVHPALNLTGRTRNQELDFSSFKKDTNMSHVNVTSCY